jgi:hypothetical protein
MDREVRMNRVWRTLAIEWFDEMVLSIGMHFSRTFLNELHSTLNLGTEKELLDLRSSCELQRKRVDEIVKTPEEDRPFGGTWEFHLLCETVFVALCDLALEDFR